MPTFHPAYLLREPDRKRDAWADLKLVMAELARLGIAPPDPPRGVMGEPPCDVLDVELALDLLEAELAAELPAHMRAFARAHAEGRPPPARAAGRAARVDAARPRATRCAHDVLADRGLALLRLVAPLVIEDDPAVVAARARRAELGRARRARARRAMRPRARGSACGAIELMHRLHGVGARRADDDAPGAGDRGLAGRASRAIDRAAIDDAWQRDRGAARRRPARCAIDRAARRSRPRDVRVEPRRRGDRRRARRRSTRRPRGSRCSTSSATPPRRSRCPPGMPRVVDEAAASYVARLAEPPSWLPPRWESELAAAARAPARRDRGACSTRSSARCPSSREPPPAATPPWALWHDPGAQAAYVAAEAIADAPARRPRAEPAARAVRARARSSSATGSIARTRI